MEELSGICFAFELSYSDKERFQVSLLAFPFCISNSAVAANPSILLISSQKFPNFVLVMNQIGIFASFAGG